MELNNIYKQEILYIISDVLSIQNNDISDVKLFFTKRYSTNIINIIKKILDKKLYFFLCLFTNDKFEYINEQKGEYYFIDSISFYRLTIGGKVYFLLFSVIYDKENIGLKKETIEIFKEK